jgi:two-component system, NtrC family, sensor kinase
VKILVIDDNAEIIDVLKVYCESQKIECRTANDATEGLNAIQNEDFDLILLDLAMPKVSGVDIVDILDKEGFLDELNVVIFTASSDHKVIEEIRKKGVKDIFKKPCSLDELTYLIKRYNKSD